MSWTSAANLKAQLQKSWDRGEILSGFVTGADTFPKRLLFKVPTSAEMSLRFDEVRVWISEIRSLSRYRVQMREFKHRLLGVNAIPGEVWVDTADDAVSILGRQRDTARFIELVATTCSQRSQLLEWLGKRPHRALELYSDWERLLEVVSWIEQHPRPGIYLRQVDLPGVHSKFIEAHRAVLSELLDIVLPPDAIDVSASGISRFSARYGFRDKTARVRFRMLDQRHKLLPCGFAQDITLDAGSFARLAPGVSRVFITENEINFLAFPQVNDSMVIFGAGYGFEMLDVAKWLSLCRIHYWGDIDTHGFAILDQPRNRFSHVESFLMDRCTLMAFESQWGTEEKQTVSNLSRLNREENQLYDDLRDNRIRKNLRLEQEMIGFSRVESAVSCFTAVTCQLG